MHNEHEHDHSMATHAANCDSCSYEAQVHAHDEEGAAMALSQDLAAHNKENHQMETDPNAIHDAVKAKMRSLG